MNVFILDADTDFGVVHGGESDDVLLYCEKFVGRPSSGSWVTPRLEPQIHRNKLYTMWVDCLATVVPSASDILLNKRAIDRLSSWLLECGELLPVRLGDRNYYWFNCFTMLNGVVDNVATRGKKFKYGDVQGWERVTNWAFHADRLVAAPSIFRVPEDGFRRLFCTDAVVDCIRSSDLIGFDIKRVWASDKASTDDPPVSFPEDYQVPPYRPNEIKAKRKAAAKALQNRQG